MLTKAGVLTNFRQQKRLQVWFLQKTLFCAVGVFATIYTMDPRAVLGYKLQFLLPLSYSIAYFVFAPPFAELGVGYQLMNAIWLIRYVLGPVLIRLSAYGIRDYAGVSNSHLSIALALMLVELWVAFFSCRVFYNRYKVRTATRDIAIREKPRNVNPKTVFVLVLLSAIIIILDRNVLSGYNFVFQDTFARRAEGVTFGTSVMMLNWCKSIVTIYLVGKFGERDLTRPSKFNVLCAFSVTILSMSFFSGMTRNGLLIEGLAFIYLLIRFFPRYKKQIFVIGSVGIFLLILTITLFRFHQTRILSQACEIFDVNSLSRSFNSYFAGQQNVAIGVKKLALYWNEYNSLTICRDLWANTVVLNRLVSDISGTVEMYNFTIYGHTLWADQISPTITQALGLFNLFGIFIPALLMWFVIKLDTFTINCRSALGVFVGAFAAAKIGFFSPGNLTIMSTAMNNYIIPLFIIFKISTLRLVFGKTARRHNQRCPNEL